MTRDDGQRFLTELNVLMAGCVKPEKLSRDRAAAFWRAFKAEPFADFKAACERWGRTSKFFPSVAELLGVLPPKPTTIPQPTASPEDRRAMLAKLRELGADLADRMSMQRKEGALDPDLDCNPVDRRRGNGDRQLRLLPGGREGAALRGDP